LRKRKPRNARHVHGDAGLERAAGNRTRDMQLGKDSSFIEFIDILASLASIWHHQNPEERWCGMMHYEEMIRIWRL
jgi:hypothetical protein